MKANLPAVAKWIVAFVVAQWLQIPTVGRVLVGMVLIDYATGWASAFVRKELSSDIGRRGIVKKAMILLLPLVVHLVETASGVSINASHAVAMAFVANELISIVENAHKIGAPIPPQLVDVLLSVQKLKKS
ncbi:MAG TPA: phage holin family protein [Terriglobia bacterium]|nr:phage holin family protein [Terriglobia bacterium]